MKWQRCPKELDIGNVSHSNMSDRASCGAPTEPGLLGIDVHERDNAARCPAHYSIVARAQIEVFLTVIAIWVSELELRVYHAYVNF